MLRITTSKNGTNGTGDVYCISGEDDLTVRITRQELPDLLVVVGTVCRIVQLKALVAFGEERAMVPHIHEGKESLSDAGGEDDGFTATCEDREKIIEVRSS